MRGLLEVDLAVGSVRARRLVTTVYRLMVNKVLGLVLRLLDLAKGCRVTLWSLKVLSTVVCRAILFDLISLGENFIERSEHLIMDEVLINLSQVLGAARARDHTS